MEEWRERGGKVGTGEWTENNGGKKRGQRTDGWEKNEGKVWDGEKKEGKRQKKDRRGWGQREEKTTVGAETNKMDGATGRRKTRQMDGRGEGREGKSDGR